MPTFLEQRDGSVAKIEISRVDVAVGLGEEASKDGYHAKALKE
jgi:hypothetical protein